MGNGIPIVAWVEARSGYEHRTAGEHEHHSIHHSRHGWIEANRAGVSVPSSVGYRLHRGEVLVLGSHQRTAPGRQF